MEEDESGVTTPLLVCMTAGCIAGAIEATATWPMEYIKTQLQLQEQKQQQQLNTKTSSKISLASLDGKRGEGDHDGDGLVQKMPAAQEEVDSDYELEETETDTMPVKTSPSSTPLPPPLFTNMRTGFIHTVQTYGFFALYFGLTPTLIGSIPKAGIRFGLFAWFSALLRDPVDGTLSIGMCFLAGLAAGAVEALLVVVPVETIKTKCIQLNLPLREGLHKIILLEGMGGMYDGVLATLFKSSSNHGLRFVWYYEYKRLMTHDGMYPLTPGWAFVGGMTAGIFFGVGQSTRGCHQNENARHEHEHE